MAFCENIRYNISICIFLTQIMSVCTDFWSACWFVLFLEILSAQIMAIGFVVPFHKSDERLLPINRRALAVRIHPLLELRVEDVQIPSRAMGAQIFDRVIGHEAARGCCGKTCHG